MSEIDAKKDALPRGMHLKSGRYYLVKHDPATKKKVWTSLSRDFTQALRQYRLLTNAVTIAEFDGDKAPSFWLAEMAKALHEQTRKRALEADIIYTLTPELIMRLGHQTNWRCAVSGLRFRQDKLDSVRMRPFMPSIDRIECNKGYVPDNCRMVCVITNFAMGSWGEGPLRELILSYVQRHNISVPTRKRVEKTPVRVED